MYRLIFLIPALICTLACQPEDELTKADVAKAFGLVDGRSMHYEVTQGSAATEDHNYIKSSSYAEKLVFTRTEKTQGFVRQESDGTAAVFDIEVTLEKIQIISRGDGAPRFVDYSKPIVLAAYPLTTGDKQEVTSEATIRENSSTSEQTEKHVFTVGDERKIGTGDGEVNAFEIGWQRTIDDNAVEFATLYWAVDLGLVGIDRFDGASLRLESHDK